jgi:hypothetical protein
MIRRNTAGQVIYLPQLTTTDGTAITSSATLTVAKDGTEAASGGDLAHVANGVWKYTPTMAETDAAIVGLILTGTSAVPVVLNLITTAADTSAVALGALTGLGTNAPANWINAAALADNAITAAKLADSAVAKIEAALLNEGDGQQLIDAIVQAIDAADISTNLTTALIRDAILNRVLAGNHDIANTVGALIQRLDATITSRNAIAPLDSTQTQASAAAAIAAAGLALEATAQSILEDTGTTLPATLSAMSGATFDTATDSLEAIRNRGDAAWITGGGGGLTGDYTLTVTVTDADDSAPIENATVTLSRTGERGAESTDANGVTVLGVDAATWSWVVRAAGYESRTGTVVISANDTLSVALDGIVVVTPSTPDNSVLTVLCLDELGEPEPGVDIDIRIVTVPSGDTNTAYKGAKQTAVSNSSGIASLQAIKGAVYEYKRGKAEIWNRVTIGSGATTNVSSFIGSP